MSIEVSRLDPVKNGEWEVTELMYRNMQVGAGTALLLLLVMIGIGKGLGDRTLHMRKAKAPNCLSAAG